MLAKLTEIIKKWCQEGMYFPFAHDPESGKSSVTLLFPYVVFVILVASLVYLHISADPLTANCMTLLTWAIAVIFHRIGKLDKVKFDLDDKSVELDGDDETENKENK